jgi:DNA-binding SARP family transcriptional activator/tetratricopeptide (TPR) repeat protein
MAVRVEFGLLGPLVVRHEGVMVPIAKGGQRALLAALLLDAGKLVTVRHLTDVLWGAAPPTAARAALHNQVRRLRDALDEVGRDRIRTQPGGYLIHLEPGELDVMRMRDLLTSARTAARIGAWDQASAMAAGAVLLWRGEPLADFDSEVLASRIPGLTEVYLQAVETRLEAEVNLGRHAEVTAELRRLIADHPFREHLHALLMLALYRCGCQGEALAVYRAARRILIGELGCEPGPELQRIHQQILKGDPGLAIPVPETADAARGHTPVPRELPRAIGHFTGRARELRALTRMLEDARDGTAETVVISAICGTAGIGKTALAVQWAHQVADRFPDGQMYVNLRGFHPSGKPVPVAGAVRGFLDALGVPAERIPAGMDGQAGMYRSLLSGKRMLVVLDNARDEEQIRPLLPGSPGCLVLVTSRSPLSGLVAAEGAHVLTLDVLTEDEARDLLARRLGATPLGEEPRAAGELIGLCAGLPLALAIAAGRAARPGLRLGALVDEMKDAKRRLDTLETGDPAVSARAVFSSSVNNLPARQLRMFRLLGVHPGPDITIPAAASLAGVPLAQARAELRELAVAYLINEHVPGRYAMHDLLHAYATEQATENEPQTERQNAIQRALDFYLHTSYAAALLLDPSREPVTLKPPRPGVTPEPLASSQQALAWFEAEHRVLMSAIAAAYQTGSDTCAWQLPWAMDNFLNWRGHWQEWATAQRTALAAANRLGDVAGQATARRLLAHTFARTGDYRQACDHLMHCLTLYRQLGDQIGEGRVHQTLGWIAERQNRYADALSHAEQALALYEIASDQARQAAALNNVGWCLVLAGNYQRARTVCWQALTLHRQLGHRRGEASTWDSLGYAEHKLGNLTEAADCHRRALGIVRELGDRYEEAEFLTHLGDVCHAAGDLREARAHWQQAVGILEDLHHPDSARVRAKLACAASTVPG